MHSPIACFIFVAAACSVVGCVTGDGTGHQIDIEDLSKVRDIVPQGRLAIGSGVNEENVEDYVDLSDILIVGTSFKVDHDVSKRVDQRSVEQLIQKIK